MTASELDSATKALLAAHPDGQRLKLSAFTQAFPEIATQIRQCADSPVLDLWGYSRNIDENSGTTITDPRILPAIGRLAKTSIRRTAGVYHAGLLHTYGYLFSLIDTPYGKKRDRWFDHKIERGLGLPNQTIDAFPKAGTLLHNLSYVLYKIIHRNDPDLLRICESFIEHVAPSLHHHDLSALSVLRISEWRNSLSSYICTDVVTSKHESPVLIYSMTTIQGSMRLLTCFPITSQYVEELTNPEFLGENQPIRLRYNAWLPFELKSSPLGLRTLLTR